LAGELILIVEDNQMNLKLVRDVLQHRGYRTLEATTAAAGLALAESSHPDLVLMDVQLPDSNGVVALARLRSTPGLDSVPVVAVTASAMKEDRDRLLRAGFSGYVAKPISTREFPDQVRAYLEGTGTGGDAT
jgi:two-component system cell cycle response regulator DivK